MQVRPKAPSDMNRSQVGLRLPPWLMADIEAYSSRHRISRPEAVRRLVREGLKGAQKGTA